MNIILPVIYYAQNFCDKIIEPAITKLIVESTIASKNKASLSFNHDLKNFIESCHDENYLEEYYYVESSILNNKELAKIYYDYIYSLLNNFCKTNKIKLNLKEDRCTFEFVW
jgi:hypothetical protein